MLGCQCVTMHGCGQSLHERASEGKEADDVPDWRWGHQAGLHRTGTSTVLRQSRRAHPCSLSTVHMLLASDGCWHTQQLYTWLLWLTSPASFICLGEASVKKLNCFMCLSLRALYSGMPCCWEERHKVYKEAADRCELSVKKRCRWSLGLDCLLGWLAGTYRHSSKHCD